MHNPLQNLSSNGKPPQRPGTTYFAQAMCVIGAGIMLFKTYPDLLFLYGGVAIALFLLANSYVFTFVYGVAKIRSEGFILKRKFLKYMFRGRKYFHANTEQVIAFINRKAPKRETSNKESERKKFKVLKPPRKDQKKEG